MLDNILDGSYMPHGHCLLWREDLLWMMVVGDGLTVIAYSMIPMSLVYLVKKRDDLKFDTIFLLFAGFIAFCGVNHFIHIVNIWNGYYYLQAYANIATGFFSIVTAFILWRLIPKILTIPSIKTLTEQNEQLLSAREDLKHANHLLEAKVRQRTEALQLLANTDQLTQLRNRRAIMEKLEHELQRSERYEHVVSILMLDVDHFKAINDTYGHLEGDDVLVTIAKAIVDSCRKIDIVGRYGGEEFLVVLPETTIDDANNLAEKIRISVANCVTKIGVKTSISIGVSTFTKGQSTLDLIKKADDRTYQAKKRGRNQVVYQG